MNRLKIIFLESSLDFYDLFSMLIILFIRAYTENNLITLVIVKQFCNNFIVSFFLIKLLSLRLSLNKQLNYKVYMLT